MKLFKDLTEKTDDIMDFKKKQEDDDAQLKKYLNECDHHDFISGILHLGVLFETISIYCEFLDLQSMIDDENKHRKINKALKDLNKKINLEYDFDSKTAIVEEGVLYDNDIYLFINKCQFIKQMQLKEL